MTGRNRVVVTGLGVVAPNGIGKEAFWQSLVEGRSGIGPITLFDASDHPCRIAGEVKDFNPQRYFSANGSLKRMARQCQFALAATHMALADASLPEDDLAPSRPVPLLIGIGCAAMDVIEEGMTRLLERGPSRVPTHTVQAGQPHHAASTVAQHLPLVTQAVTISSACAAGLDAIGMATDMVRRGKADVAICGGTDAPINPMTYACLAKSGLLTTRCNDNPQQASRPFDAEPDSGVISEGAGIVVLENLEYALARGATPYMEILGYATHVDSDLDVSGSGFDAAMEEALANASCHPADINYISAHGPGHPVMDHIETIMIKKVFGRCAYTIPISSIKGVTGNPLSAAGAMQVIACALMMRTDTVPPTTNLDTPAPDCDLDYVPGRARRLHVMRALINSHGLGGGNSALVVKRFDTR